MLVSDYENSSAFSDVFQLTLHLAAKDQWGILELDFRVATFFLPTALDVGTKHMHTATNACSHHESDYTETSDLDVQAVDSGDFLQHRFVVAFIYNNL